MDTPANRNVRNKEFKEQFSRLPEEIQELATEAFKLFCKDPSHSSLRHLELGDNKRGRHKRNSKSVSITMILSG